MPSRHRDHSLGDGVFFAPDDYAGVGRRIVIVIVDSTVIVATLIALIFVLESAYGYISLSAHSYCWASYAILVWAYLTVIKASRIRTVGYWIACALPCWK